MNVISVGDEYTEEQRKTIYNWIAKLETIGEEQFIENWGKLFLAQTKRIHYKLKLEDAKIKCLISIYL